MFFQEFPENIEKTYLKENPLMDVPYFVKEHPWMSAFAEATLFGRSKPSPKLSLKTKWYHSCGCCDDSRSCEQLKKRVKSKYFFKKSQILNPNYLPLQEMYVIITILE